MVETSLTHGLKDATDALHERVDALADLTRYQVRKNVPRVERVLKKHYRDRPGTLRDAAGNRAIQVGFAVGLLAIAAGILLARR